MKTSPQAIKMSDFEGNLMIIDDESEISIKIKLQLNYKSKL